MKGASFSAKLLQRMTNGDSPVMAVDQRMTKGGTPVTKLDRPLDTRDTLPEPGEAWPASRDRWRWRPPAFDGRSPDLTLRLDYPTTTRDYCLEASESLTETAPACTAAGGY